jgi:hypothetical protein
MKALSELGEKVDVTGLFNYFLTINNIEPEHPAVVIVIVDLLKKYPLPPNAENDLTTALRNTDIHQFNNIWALATSHHLKSFDTLTWYALEADNVEHMYTAIKYANEHFTSEPEREKYTRHCIEKIKRFKADPRKNISTIFDLSNALIKLGQEEFVANIIAGLLTQFLPEYFATYELRYSNEETPEQKEKNRFYHQHFTPILMCASKVKKHLAPDLILDIVGMEFSYYAGLDTCYIELLKDLPANALDDQIANIKSTQQKAKTLGAIASFAKTTKRELMVIQSIPVLISHSMFRDDLIKLATAYWSPDFISALVTAVSQFPWDSVSSQMFEKSTYDLAPLISLKEAKTYISPVLNQITAVSKKTDMAPVLNEIRPMRAKHILSLWHDNALLT